MTKLAAPARFFVLALLAMPLLMAHAQADDDDYTSYPWPDAQQQSRQTSLELQPIPHSARVQRYAARRAAYYDRQTSGTVEQLPPPAGVPAGAPAYAPRGATSNISPTADPFNDGGQYDSVDGGPEMLPEGPMGGYAGPNNFPFDGGGGCNQCGGAPACGRCCQCGLPGRFWVRDEYLGFWTKGDALPVLVTTSPTGTLPAEQPVFGGNTVNGGYQSGNWIQAGMWLDCCRNWGVVADYFFLGGATTNFYQASDGNPVLARPYTNALTNTPTQQLTGFPGLVVGSIGVSDSTQFQGAGINLLHNLCCWSGPCNPCDPCSGCCCSRLDCISGFQYYNLNDNLGIVDTEISIGSGTTPIGTVLTQIDSFRTNNNFYGGTLGLSFSHYRNRWVFENTAKVALGANVESISINGSTTAQLAGQPTVTNKGGLLALSSNIGSYSHTNFTAIPQLSTRVGYRITPRLTAFVGYTFIYWGQVARAGNQVNTTVNPNLIPPVQGGSPNQPSFALHEVSFWAQGITLGGQFNF